MPTRRQGRPATRRWRGARVGPVVGVVTMIRWSNSRQPLGSKQCPVERRAGASQHRRERERATVRDQHGLESPNEVRYCHRPRGPA